MPDSDTPESLVANFSPQAEARFFLHLLESGVVSYSEACESISLSERSRDWLIQQRFAEPWQILALYELRQETFRLFVALAQSAG